MPDTKTYAAPGFIGEGEKRSTNRKQRKAAAAIVRAARVEMVAERKAALDAERVERRLHAYLPAGGEPGPSALRSYHSFPVQPHRATSEVLAGAYPFLAEAGLGAAGTFVGQDAWSGGGFCFDPWVLYEQKVIRTRTCCWPA